MLDINKHRDKNYLHSVSVQLYGIYNSRLYVGIGHTPFQPATRDNYTENEQQWNLSNPTHQGTREMCRIVQGVGKLRFSF